MFGFLAPGMDESVWSRSQRAPNLDPMSFSTRGHTNPQICALNVLSSDAASRPWSLLGENPPVMNIQCPDVGITHRNHAQNQSPSSLVIIFQCKNIRSRLTTVCFACSYSGSQVLKGLIPLVKQRSLRQPDPALSCYICRVYPRTSMHHLLQKQPRRNQTAQSAADFNLMK